MTTDSLAMNTLHGPANGFGLTLSEFFAKLEM